MEIAFGIILIVLAIGLIVCVLAQSGKDKRLSGAIAGSADTFLGKSKGKSNDKLFSKITTVLAFVFAILAVVAYIYIAAKY